LLGYHGERSRGGVPPSESCEACEREDVSFQPGAQTQLVFLAL